MQEQKLTNILSIACRAGKILSGEFVIEQALGKKPISMLLVASDISDASKKQYVLWAEKHGIELRETTLEKQILGAIIGKPQRVAVAVMDNGFANAIAKILDN